MYQAYGKSETLSVSGPDPVDVPDAAPSGGGGGAAAASRGIGVCGAVVGVVRAVAGSSLSAGRGGAGERVGRLRSGSPTNTGLVRVSVHIDAPRMTTAKNATWAIADTTAGASGSRSRPSAGPM